MRRISMFSGALLLSGMQAAVGEIAVTCDRLDPADAGPRFAFPSVPFPQKADAAAGAAVTLVDGEADPNGAGIAALTDGILPAGEDDPARNFFFRPGADGGRILVDLGRSVDVRAIRSYSWHPAARGPQVYRLFGHDDELPGATDSLKRPADPAAAGWKLLATVDTRPAGDPRGGQYAVEVSGFSGPSARLRHLLFDVSRTEDDSPFGNTFFSEIDVLEAGSPDEAAAPAPERRTHSVSLAGGKYRLTVETTEAPDLTDWARDELVPVVEIWYPKIVDMLPGKDFEAPRTVSIVFTDSYRGVAATSGNRIVCNPAWYRRELKREALGSIVHELVHVAQQYRGRRGSRPPGWLIEGIPDYIRWYLYEPESRGAEIRPDRVPNVNHDDSYRVSANFLHFVVSKHDKGLIPELNAALREGRYSPDLWEKRTGHPLEDLAAGWKKSLARDGE